MALAAEITLLSSRAVTPLLLSRAYFKFAVTSGKLQEAIFKVVQMSGLNIRNETTAPFHGHSVQNKVIALL